MKRRLFHDIETRSTVDLRTAGQYVYAAHPSTQVTHFAWAIDDAPIRIWYPLWEPMPAVLRAALEDPDVVLVAHNASFERVLLTSQAGARIGVPVAKIAPLGRWNCTAGRAARFGLPRTLDGAARALGLKVLKDGEGHALMLRMCRPRGYAEDGTPLWWEDPDRVRRLGAYCITDVEVERDIDAKLPELSPQERLTWALTERMNDTGVEVDSDFLLRVAFLIDDAERDINAQIHKATNGRVPKVSNHAALSRWLAEQDIVDEETSGVGKAAVEAMLAREDLPDFIRNVLALRRDGGKSSASKYKAILKRLSHDGRIRGALVYCGAASTGRWSSRGAQLQNLARGGAVKDVEGAIADILSDASLEMIAILHGPPMVVASELVRPMFRASAGHWLARGDYSQIEARVLAWLAGQLSLIDAYIAYDAGTGPDLYRIAAAAIYHVPVDKVTPAQRQIGKVATLALGFQGGARAFQAMARGYSVKVTDETADEIKRNWRAANPNIADYDTGLWARLERAAVQCMASPIGTSVEVAEGRLRFKRIEGALALRLPSGNNLIYWSPKLESVETPWGPKRAVTYWAEDAQTKRWTKFSAYGGLWTENVVQATARDIMADALLRLHAAGMKPILTVHDEGICEVSKTRFPDAKGAAAEVERIMKAGPAWTAGLPVAADASAHARYMKG